MYFNIELNKEKVDYAESATWMGDIRGAFELSYWNIGLTHFHMILLQK